jgi:hypothetical protein
MSEQFRKGRVYVNNPVLRIDNPEGIEHGIDIDIFLPQFHVCLLHCHSHFIKTFRDFTKFVIRDDIELYIQIPILNAFAPLCAPEKIREFSLKKIDNKKASTGYKKYTEALLNRRD